MVKIAVSATSKNQSVGRRKSAAARVRLSVGSGKFMVNGRTLEQYFPHFTQRDAALSPLKLLSKEKSLDVSARVAGGGLRGQAGAVRLAVARALLKWDETFKKTLKSQGYLTRDARVKERKKFGLKKARRAPQWSKR